MKVTIVCQDFDQSSIILQPWRHIYEVSRRMVKHGISVTILSNKTRTHPQTEWIDSIKIFRIIHPILAIFVRKKLLIKALSKDRPDVILWYGTPLSAIYLTQLKSIQKPLIWVMSGDMYDVNIFRKIKIREIFCPHFKFLWRIIATAIFPRFIIRIVANSSLISKIIVPSQYLKNLLSRIGVFPRKIVIIPSTIAMEDLKIPQSYKTSVAKMKSNSQGQFFTITYMGTPCTLRGPDTLIRSIPKILEKFPNVKLVILSRRKSEDPEEEYLNKLTKKLKVENHVEIIPGIIEREKLNKLIYVSDIVALPFKLLLSEIPLSLLEAMSFGKVVISTNVGSLAEIVNESRGVLLEPNDVTMLAKAVISLLQNSEKLTYLGKRARRFAQNLPDWDEIALRLVCVLRDVAFEASNSTSY